MTVEEKVGQVIQLGGLDGHLLSKALEGLHS